MLLTYFVNLFARKIILEQDILLGNWVLWMSGIQDIESNNEAMICTGDNPAHNQTMYKDVYKYIFYQGCLNGLMIITGHKPAH